MHFRRFCFVGQFLKLGPSKVWLFQMFFVRGMDMAVLVRSMVQAPL